MTNTLKITNPNAGIQEEFKIGEITQPNKIADEIFQYFVDDKKVEDIMLQIVTGKIRTTIDLSKAILEIKLAEMRKELDEYLETVKSGEKSLLEYFKGEGLLLEGAEKVELEFNGDFIGIPKTFDDFFKKFTLNKKYKKQEFLKVKNDKNKKYKFVFDLRQTDEGELFIKDFRIEEIN